MKYKLVIFDFDGTLADSFPWFMTVVNQVADKYKFRRIEESEVEALRGYNAKQLIRYAGVPVWKLPMIGNHVRKRMADEIGEIRLFEGVDVLLRELAERGVTLAVVSSNSQENIRRVLGPENAARIQYYECGVSIFGKHTLFRKVLKKSGVLPGEAICIGDEIRDVEAAQREKIAFGAVSWGFTSLEALRAYSPTEVFTSVDEILEGVT
jgi:phosphoglycolate phosphatase